MQEAILFLFIKSNEKKVLLENRLTLQGTYDEILVPGGGIEDYDYINGKDHKEVALHREITEEFAQQVQAHTYEYIDHIDTIDKHLRFHIFFIHGWHGEHPAVMDHDGDKAKLVWVNIEDAKKSIQSEAGTYAIMKADQLLNT